jgi:hypothetical protein
MEGVCLSSETVLRVVLHHYRFDFNPDVVYFHPGDIVNVNIADGNIRGRLNRVDDDEIELDVSTEFNSKLIHIPFDSIHRIVKEDK